MVQRLGTLTILVLSLLLLTSDGLVEARPEQSPGKSANAKTCQKGGYATLARSESPTLVFTTAGACVSYAAQGGVLVPLAGIGQTETLSFVAAPAGIIACIPQLTVTGYAAGSYSVTFSPFATEFVLEVGPDGTGMVVGAVADLMVLFGQGASVTAALNGAPVATALAAC